MRSALMTDRLLSVSLVQLGQLCRLLNVVLFDAAEGRDVAAMARARAGLPAQASPLPFAENHSELSPRQPSRAVALSLHSL